MKHKKKILKFAFFSSMVIVLIHLINRIISKCATIEEKIFSKNANQFKWRFGKIFYTVQGTGKPILLIHDLTTSNSDCEWSQIVGKLSQNNTVYTIDLLGCGRSDKPKITYTNYLYVQLISDFIQKVIKQKTNIISSGSSSTSALLTCFQDKSLIDKLLIINPPSISSLAAYPRKKNKILKYLLEIPVLGTFYYHIAVSKLNISWKFKHDYFYNPSKIRKKYIDIFHESAHIDSYNAKYLFSSISHYYTNQSITHALKIINNSIYLLGGEFEIDIQNTISSYCTENSSIEYSTIKNTKHLPHLESPTEVLEICHMFFS